MFFLGNVSDAILHSDSGPKRVKCYTLSHFKNYLVSSLSGSHDHVWTILDEKQCGSCSSGSTPFLKTGQKILKKLYMHTVHLIG